jgi:hypothetical protein
MSKQTASKKDKAGFYSLPLIILHYEKFNTSSFGFEVGTTLMA